MSVKEIKAVYEVLNENGDLTKFFPSMTGSWEKDGKRFTREYKKNEIILDDIEIGDLEDDSEFF